MLNLEFMTEINIISACLAEIRQQFIRKHNSVETFFNSPFHDEMKYLQFRKKKISSAIMTMAKESVSNPMENGKSLAVSSKLVQNFKDLEANWKETVKLIQPTDPTTNCEIAFKAIHDDLERNYNWFRRILSNLPNQQQWMHFLSILSNEKQLAAQCYYQASLNEIEQRAKNITKIFQLIRHLNVHLSFKNKTNQLNELAALTDSTTSCQKLCYQVWLRLLELIIYLEKQTSFKKSLNKPTDVKNSQTFLTKWWKKFSEEYKHSHTDDSKEEYDFSTHDQNLNNHFGLTLKQSSNMNQSNSFKQTASPNSNPITNVITEVDKQLKSQPINECNSTSCSNFNGEPILAQHSLLGLLETDVEKSERHSMFANVELAATPNSYLQEFNATDLPLSVADYSAQIPFPSDKTKIKNQINLKRCLSEMPNYLLNDDLETAAYNHFYKRIDGKPHALKENAMQSCSDDHHNQIFSNRIPHLMAEDLENSHFFRSGLNQLYTEKPTNDFPLNFWNTFKQKNLLHVKPANILPKRRSKSQSPLSGHKNEQLLNSSQLYTPDLAKSGDLNFSDPRLVLLNTNDVENNSLINYRVNSYLDAAAEVEQIVRNKIPISYSNVDFTSDNLKHCLHHKRFHKTSGRSNSVDVLHPWSCGNYVPKRTAKKLFRTNSLTFSTNSTCGFETSEHIMTYWDNYQAPYYSSSEFVGPIEPVANIPPNLAWDEFGEDETEALNLDLESSYVFDEHHIDEWSFDGMSGSSSLFLKTNSVLSGKKNALNRPNLKSKTNKSQQTEDLFQSTTNTLTNTASPVDCVKSRLPIQETADLTTTQTSGYESGQDLGDSGYRKSPHKLISSNIFPVIDHNIYSNVELSTRNVSIQADFTAITRSNLLTSNSIPEETSLSGSSSNEQPNKHKHQVSNNTIIQSENSLIKLRDFLHRLLKVEFTRDWRDCSQSNAERHRLECCNHFTVEHYSLSTISAGLVASFRCLSESTKNSLTILDNPSKNHVTNCLEIQSEYSSNAFKGQQRSETCHGTTPSLDFRWRCLAAWIEKRLVQLDAVNQLQSQLFRFSLQIRELSDQSKNMLVNREILSVSGNTVNERIITYLLAQSIKLDKELETLHKLAISKRLSDQTTDESAWQIDLRDLENDFVTIYNEMLDHCLKQLCSLTDTICITKAKFSYLNTLSNYQQHFLTADKTIKNNHLKNSNDNCTRIEDSISRNVFECPKNRDEQENRFKLTKYYLVILLFIVIVFLSLLRLLSTHLSFPIHSSSMKCQSYTSWWLSLLPQTLISELHIPPQ